MIIEGPSPVSWRFDHVGLVVKSLAKGRKGLSQALRIGNWTAPITDNVNGVHLQFGRDCAGIVYELLEPIDHTSPVFTALSSGKAILNHVAYLVADLDKEASHLRTSGCGPAGPPNPAIAYNGARIQFFVTPVRFIIELIEAPDHQHQYSLSVLGD